MMLTAPSGAGKTETYRAIKQYFGIYAPSLPVYIRDASSITATGYKGSDPAYIVAPLCHTGLHRPVGLVFLDEFDKKILPSYNAHGENTNAEAQYGLLTIVEGSDVEIKDRGRILRVNTDKVMFIGLGSFPSPPVGLSPKAMKSPKKLLNHCFYQGSSLKSQLKSNEKPQKVSKSLLLSGLKP